jgi:dipicolinate synthase subunit A
VVGRLAGMTVAVVGGDRREQEICRLAARAGGIVRAYGIPVPASGLAGVTWCNALDQALADAELCLLPLPLPGADGTLYAPAAPAPIRPQVQHFARMRRSARIIAGSVNRAILREAAAAAIPIDSYGADLGGRRDRAVAIAEGAAARVIGATEHTIRGARVAVLGNGVVGQAVADLFGKLGARIYLFGRSPHLTEVLPLARLAEWAPGLDVLLSTIPAAVAAPEIFTTLPSHALVVDMAAPAGIAPAAESAGARTLRALGLGDCAPVTVGAIQWRQILALLCGTSEQHHVPSA